jgi:hypothetical protein
MTTKVCANNKCPAYAHFVYTLAMRCVLCKWDLKAAQRSGEGRGFASVGPVASSASNAVSSESGGAHAAR